MINPLQSVSAMSFTRQMDGVEMGGSSSITNMPGMQGAAQAPVAGADFGTTLASLASDMVTDLRGAEQASFDGITGKADTRVVVDAVMNAEQTLQTALAIRDKIVAAYLEVSRMQI